MGRRLAVRPQAQALLRQTGATSGFKEEHARLARSVWIVGPRHVFAALAADLRRQGREVLEIAGDDTAHQLAVISSRLAGPIGFPSPDHGRGWSAAGGPGEGE